MTKLKDLLRRHLHTFMACNDDYLLSAHSVSIDAKASLSVESNHRTGPLKQLESLRNLAAYLAIVSTGNQVTLLYIQSLSGLLKESKSVDGRAFCEPAWVFQYPQSLSLSERTVLSDALSRQPNQKM
jgi:hypothetical protein